MRVCDRLTARGVGDRACYRGFRDRRAFGKFKFTDARQPREITEVFARLRVVFVRDPESAVVVRVDRHRAVIAPPKAERLLNARAVRDRSFFTKSTWRIIGQLSGIEDARFFLVIDKAVADGNISPVVLRRSTKPPRRYCVAESRLLHNR